MLRLLLDEHISPAVAQSLKRRHRSLLVHPMTEGEDGSFLDQDDASCLLEAAPQRLTLVTYDRWTIPPLPKLWAEEGRKHGGIIFVDEKTIAPADIGALVLALGTIVRETGKWSWTDRVTFLSR